MAVEQIVEVDGHRVKLTNLDKVLYPETGTTKAEVLDYYSRVAAYLIPHAKDRPATRKRWPNGVGGQMFFEKQLPAHAPDWIRARPIEHSEGPKTYPLINDLPTLIWLAQMAALELHVPQWRFDRNGARKNPDRMVLDLDPGEGAGLEECVEVAKLVRTILQGMGLDPMPVTSGSKGVHLYAALDGSQTSDEVSAVAHELARILEAEHPDLVVSDMKKALRGGKVLLDWSQNNGSKTTIVPYSLRGRDRPMVAAPRTWKELTSPGLRHLEFHEVLARLKKPDPLADLSAGHVTDTLATYRSMRDAGKTPEPMGAGAKGPGDTFVIQEHHTPGRVHFDFRLEKDGVLVSWAVPKNVPTDPGQNHLAVHTEDHPLEYGSFEGTIPKGEYGAGTVTIWDAGSYEREKFSDDEVVVILHGAKLDATRVALIHTNDDNWLMHLMKDQRKGAWSSGRKAGTASKPLRKSGKTVVGSRTGSAVAVAPMLATLGDPEGFTGGPEWAYEMKWDGYRAVATIRDGVVNLRSRNGLDMTATYPELGELADAVDGDAVLDGEIVALDRQGRPRFELLQRHEVSVQYFVFDAIELGGEQLTSLPYEERRARLVAAITETDAVRLPPDAGRDLKKALATSRKLGLEGVMAKRRDSSYRLGKRSRDWIKLKHVLTQEVVVGGWKPGKGNRADTVGSLLLGVPEEGRLRYVGKVGTGFTDAELKKLRTRLDALARKTAPLDGVPAAEARAAHWVTPTLVGEVVYAETTGDGRLRAPAWKGWRPDKDPGDVVRELPSSS
ncbi:MAG TPA: ATP-dependent DNA ligase [Pseudolysinimonas sp.]|nr:ATP-dependent DNA ligase [Pseudolysinimonas sp.]